MTNPSRMIWVDGRLIPWAQATVHVLSQSLQRGSLVFDLMACVWLDSEPAIFGLTEHLDRFESSMRLSRMVPGPTRKDIEAGVRAVVHASPGATQVKVSAYYPSPSLDVLPLDASASVAIAAYSAEDIDPSAPKAKPPARLGVAESRKMPGWVLSPQAKLAAGYLYTSVAKLEAKSRGFDEVLLLDEADCIAEGSVQSFFWAATGTLFTAPTSTVLAGVTRIALLDIARLEGIEVREVSEALSALDTADEAFLAGTTARVWPVAQVEERRFPSAPGPVTARLRARLDALLAGEDASLSPRWLARV
jgi:branched-chain amino acid aminotransferase